MQFFNRIGARMAHSISCRIGQAGGITTRCRTIRFPLFSQWKPISVDHNGSLGILRLLFSPMATSLVLTYRKDGTTSESSRTRIINSPRSKQALLPFSSPLFKWMLVTESGSLQVPLLKNLISPCMTLIQIRP